jgi:hypothetical protein
MDKKELLILSNALNNEYGFELIYILLEELGAFDRGLNRNASDKEIFMQLGKREKGVWLLDNIFKANKEKYTEILEKKEREINNG